MARRVSSGLVLSVFLASPRASAVEERADRAAANEEPPVDIAWKRRSPALFATGMGLSIAGGLTMLVGASVWATAAGLNPMGMYYESIGWAPPPADERARLRAVGAAVLVSGAALTGIGVWLTALGGKRVPVGATIAPAPGGAALVGTF